MAVTSEVISSCDLKYLNIGFLLAWKYVQVPERVIKYELLAMSGNNKKDGYRKLSPEESCYCGFGVKKLSLQWYKCQLMVAGLPDE